MSILSNSNPGSIDLKTDIGPDEIYDLLKDDDKPEEKDEKEEKPDEEVKEEKEGEEDKEEEKEEEVDELKEIEEELELEDKEEDDLEIIQPVRRAEILRKYPKIFQDFPYLEKAYYRERKYSEIFPSPADAQTAHERAETLDNFEQELLGGDLTKVLESVKKENNESFNRIADNYLMSLAKVDEKAYHHVVGNIIRRTIYNMVKEGRDVGGDQGQLLENTATILNQYVFGTAKLTSSAPLSKAEPDKSEREKQLEEREKALSVQKFEEARGGLEDKIEKILKHNIGKHIDPKNSMTSYIKGVAERDALETTYKLISKDSRFAALRDKLWQHAEKNNFSSESIGKIQSAYLSKAQTLLASVIKKARNEALKGMGKRIKEESIEEEQEPKDRKSDASPKRSDNRVKTKPGQIPAGMSNRDFLMSD